jgi:predicted nucleotidyltransferase
VAEDGAKPDTNALCAAIAHACDQVPEVRLAYVFGSQLRGNARADSDLDIAIDVGHAASAAERGRVKLTLIGAISDSMGALGERADIVDLREASPGVAFRVIKEGRIAKEVSRAERVVLTAKIMRAYDDDAPRRALFLRAAVRAARQWAKDAQNGRR